MAVINFAHREITAKIVYFGATGAGCNTNVRALYELLEGTEVKSRLHEFGPGDTKERTWYFDVQVPASKLSGFTIRYRVYSMPGGLTLLAHRKQVMEGVDAIVLVADSRADAANANEQALLELEEVLAEQELELAGLPVVLQVNQTDREGARDETAVVFDLNPYGFPVLSAAAKSHVGVRDTFDRIATLTLERIRLAMAGEEGAIALKAVHRPTAETDDDVVKKHLAALRREGSTASERTLDAAPSTATPPGSSVEVPFQPRDFAGSYPVRVVEANMEDGQVYVDVEFERMGGGETRQLRVKLANRPTDSPAMPRPVALPVTSASPVMNVTQNLPDKVELTSWVEDDDMPPVWYGILGIGGGIVTGVMIGFLLFH
ncbi:MAG: GTPase domain-containing protein [Alphaproteobacteria bacterium]|nr:GTPase domain-containing protein [Alphaproteobacteria bacterium]